MRIEIDVGRRQTQRRLNSEGTHGKLTRPIVRQGLHTAQATWRFNHVLYSYTCEAVRRGVMFHGRAPTSPPSFIVELAQ